MNKISSCQHKATDPVVSSVYVPHPAPSPLRTRLAPVAALLLCTAMWGSTFAMQKDVLARIDVFDFLGIRFFIAGVVCLALFWKRLRKSDWQTWKLGIVLGVLYGIGQEMQSYGLSHTSASVTGFLTGMYVILTPVLAFVIFKVRQPKKLWIAVAVATIGLGVMSLKGFSLGIGESLVLISALVYAVHLLLIERYVQGRDPIALTAIQMLVLGVVSVACALPGGVDFPSGEAVVHDWSVLIYMAVGSGIGSLLLQTWAQSRIGATHAALVMISEPVWSALFAVLLIHEAITVRVALGGFLIISAMLMSQIDVPWLRVRSESDEPQGAWLDT